MIQQIRARARNPRSTLGAAIIVLALVTAACGGSSGGSGSGAGGATGGSGAATSSQAVKFAECMRNHGVKDFPDPDASGQLTIDAVANSSVDTNAPAFTQAISACKDLEPSGFTGHKRTAEQQVGALRFAQCVRDHGIKDFPDPGPDDPLIDTNRIPSAATDAGIALLNVATKQCGDLAGAAGVTGGR